MEQHEWWQRGVIYQIYPRSFQDSDGDGVGDIPGIISRLDYLQWLGVDAIWLSPVFPSPMADFGYDVADYCDIDPLFGSLADFDRLMIEARRRSLRIILDFVPNHTSDQHPWFLESRSSRTSSKRDWYIWRDPAPDGGPPNNWLSSFGGDAWTYDDLTGQYYHHHFLAAQPDLNWRNPAVVDAMLTAMRFWLDRGVSGFRLDVIWLIIKDDEFRNNPANEAFQPNEPPHHRLLATYTTDRPEVHDIINRMRRLIDSYDERMLVGEIYLPVERLVTYYGAQGSGVHLPFNFQLIHLPWQARTIAASIDHYEASLPAHGWPNWVLGNHDQPRLATRLGPARAAVAAMLLLTLRGTPTLYYGDEIGMQNGLIPADRIQDPFEKNVPGIGLGRDPQRTPMQWDTTQNCGFSQAEPWLPISQDATQTNVEMETADERSLLHLYRQLLRLRRDEPALAVGTYHPLTAEDNVLAYVRRYRGRAFLIALNMNENAADLLLPYASGYEVILSTQALPTASLSQTKLTLRGNEGLILQVID